MTELDPKHQSQFVGSFDGTQIATRLIGEGDGLPLLVSNAAGGNFAVWRRALVDVVRERRVILWDHRGMYESAAPVSDRIDLDAHREDALACLEHWGVGDFAIASWSNGSRIALELARHEPKRVQGLAVICGGYGQPIRRLLRWLELSAALPVVAGVAKHFGSALEKTVRTLAARPELPGIVRQSGLIGPTADITAITELVRGIASCDFKMFLALFEELAGAGSPQIAEGITVPTLLVAGERDRFTSRRMKDEMHAVIAGSRLVVYDRATHYLPMEYPARLSEDLRTFLSPFRG